MKKRILNVVLALILLMQAFIPNLAYALGEDPQGKKTIVKEEKFSDANLITIGKLKGVGFSKDNPTASISVEEVKEKNHKNTDSLNGLEIGDEIVPQAVRGTGSQYIQGQQPADSDKPKYWANVKGKLTTVGLDGGNFDWDKVLGKDAKIKLLFTQSNDYVMTGVTYTLLVDKDGTYTWHGSDGKPTYLPIFDENGNGYSYNVQIERNYSEDVHLIISESNGTPGVAWRKEGDKEVATISFLNIEIQQVASTKFVSEWNTALAEEDRPQIEGYFKVEEDVDNDFNFPLNNTDKTILRDGFVKNFEEGDEENGPWPFLYSELKTTPETVEVKTDTQGLTFEENNGVKTVKSGDHKFKYDFTYDVINGGKLTMTEILPVTFNANGGKFASITEPNAEQKIVKEVEYDKNLTEDIETPKKDRETFKGWATTQGGTPLSEYEFKAALKNIKEAKTFYAIWDNNDITAEELTVHESFKDGTGYVNDFIPTLETLKGQVKIKDASGTPQALEDTDTFAIVDGTDEYKTDTEAKDYLYNLLKEDDATEVSRNVILKAKVNLKNGTSKEVEIPIKVIKNIYEAKTEEGKPNYVPDDYVKVTVDPTTKAEKPQKYFYYVNPKAKVVIPGTDPTGTGENLFVKWTYDDNGTETEYKLSKKPRHQFKNPTTITAQYSADVIPQTGEDKPDTVPANFVEVKFVPTDKATDTAEKIYWVNPKKEVTIPVENPVGKQYYTFAGWKIGVNADGDDYTPTVAKQFTDENGTIITATYTESDNIIPYDPKDPKVKPDGYITVSFDADLGLKLKEVKYYFVKKNTKDTSGNALTLKTIKEGKDYGYPKYEKASGYDFDKWDLPDTTEIKDQDFVVTAKAKQESTPSKPGDGQGYGPSYPEVVYRDRVVEKEKIVEKIVHVDDGMNKEIRYMQGFDGFFRPYDGLSRAEAAQILANALREDGYVYNPNFVLPYSDVGDMWYTEAVKVVTEAGVFKGDGNGLFKPTDKITRAEWIATLRRFQNLQEANGNTMNLKAGHWATNEVQAAYEAGWLDIYQNGIAKFASDEPITRQEVAAVSNKAFRRVLDKIYIDRNYKGLINYKDIDSSMALYEDILCASNTFLHDGRRYRAHGVLYKEIKFDHKTIFNIDTDDLKISQDKFQYILR